MTIEEDIKQRCFEARCAANWWAAECKEMKTEKEIIAETGASSMKDMGKVMGLATQRMKGLAEGKTISKIVKNLLSS